MTHKSDEKHCLNYGIDAQEYYERIGQTDEIAIHVIKSQKHNLK